MGRHRTVPSCSVPSVEWRAHLACGFVGFVSCVEVDDVLEAHRRESVDLHVNRVEHEADVVAVVVEHGSTTTDEPVAAVRKQWDISGAEFDRAQLKLVDVIARGRSEQLGECSMLGTDEMHRQMRSVERCPIRVVGLRQPYRVARWIDAALAVEPHETPGAMPERRCRDDGHGTVQPAHQRAVTVVPLVHSRDRIRCVPAPAAAIQGTYAKSVVANVSGIG
jgi:hypothetical protein